MGDDIYLSCFDRFFDAPECKHICHAEASKGAWVGSVMNDRSRGKWHIRTGRSDRAIQGKTLGSMLYDCGVFSTVSVTEFDRVGSCRKQTSSNADLDRSGNALTIPCFVQTGSTSLADAMRQP